jgi:general secretion pathway protein G
MNAKWHPRQSGLSLLELMITMAIAAVIGTVAIPGYRSHVDRSRTAAAIGDISAIHLDIQRYILNWGGPPPDLAAVGQDGRKDPWGRPYLYLSFEGLKGKGAMRKNKDLVPINSQYDLYSSGPDGESRGPLTAKASRDDIVLANDGGYIGPVAEY